MGYFIMVLTFLVIMSWIFWTKKSNNKVEVKSKLTSLDRIIPNLRKDDVILVGLTDEAVERVSIWKLNKNEVSNFGAKYKMFKVIENRTDIIKMLNYQGYAGRKIRNGVLAFIEQVCDPEDVIYLTENIRIDLRDGY